MNKTTFILVLSFLFLGGCSVNPVTGKSELVFMSTADEIALGQQNYAPMQQSQGGEYDVDPDLTRYVQNVGQKVAAQSNVDLPYEFVVLNNSVPNAWALPGGKIAINRGLLTEMNSEAELAAVLGHEVVHAAARHTAQQQSRAMLMQMGVLGTAIAARDNDYGNLIVGGANVLAQAGLARYGRSAELQSDLYGMQYMSKAGYDPQGAVELQQTFVRLSEGRRSDWLSGLFASHPPSQERVEANRRTAATLPAGGIEGKDAYAAALSQTRRTEPAYEAYDEGRKALSEKKFNEALAKAETALNLYGEEAHFHALRGDIRLMQENFDWAVTNYSRAIDRRNDFFYYHLQRGLAKKELGQISEAETDLNRSLELLPTAPAHTALGDIAKSRGRTGAAISHYKVVAKSGGAYGEYAANELARMELPSNPSAYISRGCSADANGNLVASVRNDTKLDVTGVQVTVTYNEPSGRTGRRFALRGIIGPGQIASVNTGLGPWSPEAGCPVTVTAARIVD